MIKLSELKKDWLKDSEMQKRYKESKPEFELAKEFIRARSQANMSQLDVAKKMKTTQSVISRIESGQTIVTTKTIDRFAKAVGMDFEFHFVPIANT